MLGKFCIRDVSILERGPYRGIHIERYPRSKDVHIKKVSLLEILYQMDFVLVRF